MKPLLTKLTLALFLLTTLAAFLMAEQPSQSVLGKINFAALFDAAPALPVTTQEAAKRTFGPDVLSENPAALERFYESFNQRVAAARDVIKPAVDGRPARQEAMAQRATAEAENSPIIARMGGIEKMSEMSDEQREKAAMQAAVDYQQSMAGGHGETSRGMQSVMQRVMNDPAYRERFEKMSPAEQEAEMRKAMGPGAPVAQHTAAEEQRASQGTKEAGAVMAKLNELNAIHQRIVNIDTEFTNRDKAISAAPGGYTEIARASQAKIEKIPRVETGVGPMPEPVKFRAAQRERATLDRNRASWELQQRAALYLQRKTDYKAAAASYAAWLRQNVGPASGSAAKLMQEGAAEVALSCEEEMIGLAQRLAKSSHEATEQAANYELAYRKKMSER